MQINQFLPQKGNYQNLIVYQETECIYDITFYFAHHSLAKSDRTVDQMVRVARPGKQNVAGGYAVSTTSSETETELLNVVKASLQELLIDYQDYLWVGELVIWDINDAGTIQTRRVRVRHNGSAYYQNAIKERGDETIVNIAIILIHQAGIFPRKYINRVKNDFVKQGGIREQMLKARIDYRKSHR